MTTISLRAYNREIESMVDNGHFEEANAHCCHILQIYPKHIDTYRLLGRAFMECERFSDAEDVFQRLLSSVPDDFISHLGMSVIRENQENFDAAIWHMERAYDVQPANTSVQSELKRLFRLRDEIEPAKIHLTRDALARMYLKGDLYPQAISELQSALAEDENRFDLETMLARAFLLAGKKNEAVELSSSLIQNHPYCLEANRILAEVLPEIDRAEEAAIYRERLQALDPYSAHYSTQITSSEEIPDSAVMLEKYEYIPEEPNLDVEEEVEWVSTMGSDFEGLSPSEDSLPDWLSKPLEEAPPAAEEDILEPQEESESIKPLEDEQSASQIDSIDGELPPEKESQPDELIPDWMRSSGWEPASPTSHQSPPSLEEISEELSQAEEISDADLPDWLKDSGPIVESEPVEDEGESIPWLKEPTDEPETVATWLNETKAPGVPDQFSETSLDKEEEFPEWLEDDQKTHEGVEEKMPTEELFSQEDYQMADLEAASQTGIPDEDSLDIDEEKDKADQEIDSDVETEMEIPEWLRARDITQETTLEEVSYPGTRESIEQPQETTETTYISDEDDLEVDQDTTAIEMPTILEKPEEIEEREEGEIEEEETSGVTDWLRTLEEIEGEITTEEQPTSIEPESKDAARSDEELPIDDHTGVTGWLKTLEEIEGGQVSEEEALTEGTDIESQFDEVELLDEDKEIEVLDESVEMGELAESQEPEQLTGEKISEQIRPPAEEAVDKDEEAEKPEKRVPGVTDWLRTLKEIEDKDVPEEEKLLAESETDLETKAGEEEVPGTRIEDQEVSIEGDTSIIESGSAEMEGGEVPDWLQGLEFELSADHETDVISTEFPDWLQTAAEEEEVEEGEIDWSIFSDEEVIADETQEIEQEEALGEIREDQLEEPTPILGDTQPIRREEKEEEQLVEPISVPEEEISGELEEEELGREEEQPVAHEEEAAALEWLDSLASRVELQEDETIAAEEDAEEQPEWSEKTATDKEVEIETEKDFGDISEWIEEEVELEVESPEILEKSEISTEQIEEFELISEEGEAEPAVIEEEGEPLSVEAEKLEPVSAEVEAEPAVIEEEGEPLSVEAKELEPVSAEVEAEPAVLEEEEEPISAEAEEFEPVSAEVEAEPAGLEEEEVPVSAEAEELEPVSEEAEAEPAVLEEEEVPVSAEAEELEPVSEEAEAEPTVLEEEEVPVSAEAEEIELISEEVEAEPAVQETKPEVLAETAIDVNTASLAQLEQIPGVGFIVAQSIIDYREEHGSVEDLDELANIPNIDQPILEEIRPWLFIETLKEEPVEEISKDPELLDAWLAIESGKIDVALEQYQQLIKDHRYLDDIILDLTNATQLYPNEVPVYVTLGDAYFHKDKLQEALEVYLQAEELLK